MATLRIIVDVTNTTKQIASMTELASKPVSQCNTNHKIVTNIIIRNIGHFQATGGQTFHMNTQTVLGTHVLPF